VLEDLLLMAASCTTVTRLNTTWEFNHFCVLFQSVFLEGFGRPRTA